MFQSAAAAGTGPQFQGPGRPEWQQVGGQEAVSRANVMQGGPQIQNMGNAMGAGPATTGPGAGRGNQAARQGGYYASQPGAMGTFARQTGAKPLEQPKWMARK
jgi:hypothetical protein